MNIADQLHYAEKVDNYEVDATSGILWVSTTNFRVTCPASKRWFLIGGVIKRTVSATVIGYVRDSSDNILHKLCDEAAATATTNFPDKDYVTGQGFVLDAGDDVSLTFGVAQNASAYASCVVLEVDI